jgi:hypothetical protein
MENVNYSDEMLVPQLGFEIIRLHTPDCSLHQTLLT